MGLFVPVSTPADASKVFTNATFTKGQLYNLDLQQFIGFQFNPEFFEWERSLNWVRGNWFGNTHGGELQFINSEPRKIELTLIWVASPGAPVPEAGTDNELRIVDNRAGVDLINFHSIITTIDKWQEPITGLGRPSRLAIIIGPNKFEGVIVKYVPRITDFFPDLSAREAILTLEFEEWVPIL